MTRAKSGPQVMPGANENHPLDSRIQDLADKLTKNPRAPLSKYEEADYKNASLASAKRKASDPFQQALAKQRQGSVPPMRGGSVVRGPWAPHKSATDQLRDWSKDM